MPIQRRTWFLPNLQSRRPWDQKTTQCTSLQGNNGKEPRIRDGIPDSHFSHLAAGPLPMMLNYSLFLTGKAGMHSKEKPGARKRVIKVFTHSFRRVS